MKQKIKEARRRSDVRKGYEGVMRGKEEVEDNKKRDRVKGNQKRVYQLNSKNWFQEIERKRQ